ncbi:uncharacterized protein LOC117173086 [Belonocnema kinseyi]|uniref:uncharacterized protein LOC117173086 n=1 Tax=Belonocnema kinseyi TaxID=2817044 RepID=UPI00143DBACD|nr:uncharacterized protein LOC117173086 [Belonocnema kinseyi]
MPIGITEKYQKLIEKSCAGPSNLPTSKLIILSKRRREMWISVLRRRPLSASQLKNSRICKKHFRSGIPADLANMDYPDRVPCQKLGDEKGTALKRKISLPRYHLSAKTVICQRGLKILLENPFN